MSEVNTRTTDSFFLVWTKTGRKNPRRSHPTREEATAEAERLALKHPDKRWFVLAAVSRHWVNEASDRLAGESESQKHIVAGPSELTDKEAAEIGVWVDHEAVGWIRKAMADLTGTNCTFVDDDLKALSHLASRAIGAGLIDELPSSLQACIDVLHPVPR